MIETKFKLTKQEVNVLRACSDCNTSREIADTLFISERTVHFHLCNIYDKMQCRTKLQAYVKAERAGLL